MPGKKDKSRKSGASARKVIGRMEKIDLPELELSDVDAKIDTGAFSSSLHVHHVHEGEKMGKPIIRFRLVHPRHPSFNNQEFALPVRSKKIVKSSTGEAQLRYIIRTSVVLFGKRIRTEFSLADRSSMEYPVLLGRKLLSGRFLVDVSQKNLSRKFKKKKAEKKKMVKKKDKRNASAAKLKPKSAGKKKKKTT